MKKIIIYLIVFLGGIFFVLTCTAIIFEKSIYKGYWKDYDDFRNKNGIYPLTISKDTITDNWDNLLKNNQYIKWKWILTNESIGTTTTFNYESNSINPYHDSKIIYYRTQLFFWDNNYNGEIDYFINPLNPDTNIELTIAYNFKNINRGNYFYAYIDTVYFNQPEVFRCALASIEESQSEYDKKSIGNLTKDEADEILTGWGLK